MRLLPRSIDIKGELFSSTFTYGVTAAIKFASSLILTRLLSPEAYGIFGILMSITFVIELVSDVGFVALLVRHPRGAEVKFVHTIWTVRLFRCCLLFSITFLSAPLVSAIYGAPALEKALRVLSLQFLISAPESMSFILAQRDRRARISNYADMISGALSSAFVILLAIYLKNHFAFILGFLFQRALLTIASHFFYRDIGIGFAFDRQALADQFSFTRLVMPSSMLTMVLSQYDKLVLLKLFNLGTLGVYGLAQNMIGLVNGMIMHNARVVLYARCAEYFRTNPATACSRYYKENSRLLLLGMILPALVAGFSQPIVDILYDARYSMAGPVLMILGLSGIISSFHHASENLLVASGQTHVVLVANIVRLCTVVPATLIGYYFFGLYGFLWFNLVAALILLAYFYFEQKKRDLLRLGNEVAMLCVALTAFLLSAAAGHLLLKFIPASWLHLGTNKH